MKINLNLILAFLLGFASCYAYNLNRSIFQQINLIKAQATVEALVPLCPKVFEHVIESKELAKDIKEQQVKP